MPRRKSVLEDLPIYINGENAKGNERREFALGKTHHQTQKCRNDFKLEKNGRAKKVMMSDSRLSLSPVFRPSALYA